MNVHDHHAPDDAGDGQQRRASTGHVRPAVPRICATLTEHQARRRRLIRQMNRLRNDGKAMGRRFYGFRWDLPKKERDAIKKRAADLFESRRKAHKSGELPDEETAIDDYLFIIIDAMSPLIAYRKVIERSMADLAIELPAAEWIMAIPGLTEMSLAAIVGEAGDLSNYDSHSKLWKRLGLHVVDGQSARRVKGDEAMQHAYNAERRSVIWNIGEAMRKCADCPYRKVYLDRKAREIEKARDDGLTIVPAAKLPKKDRDKYRSQGHVHRRAQRYAEKKLVRDLWKAWR